MALDPRILSRDSLIHEMFVRTADEDYITARWAMASGLDTTFCWLAAHCLEKYMKAVLLANGGTSRGYGHRIDDLYATTHTLVGDLLPDRFERPDWIDESLWVERTPDQFIARLADNGNADNRYQIFGYMVSQQDLFLLDQLAFRIRRLVHDLAGHIKPGDQTSPTFREALAADRALRFQKALPLDQCLADPQRKPFTDAALNRNFAFAPADFPHSGAVAGHVAREPIIIRRILEPLKHDDPRFVRTGLDVATWLIANVQLPPAVAKQIEDAMTAAEQRLSQGGR